MKPYHHRNCQYKPSTISSFFIDVRCRARSTPKTDLRKKKKRGIVVGFANNKRFKANKPCRFNIGNLSGARSESNWNGFCGRRSRLIDAAAVHERRRLLYTPYLPRRRSKKDVSGFIYSSSSFFFFDPVLFFFRFGMLVGDLIWLTWNEIIITFGSCL